MKNKAIKTTGIVFATNMFGIIKPEIIKRVEKYLRKPTFDNWDNICGIIIDGRGKMKTIWNAVSDNDPFFPHYGRRTDAAGNVLREWERIPTPDEVIEAINKTVFPQLQPSN